MLCVVWRVSSSSKEWFINALDATRSRRFSLPLVLVGRYDSEMIYHSGTTAIHTLLCISLVKLSSDTIHHACHFNLTPPSQAELPVEIECRGETGKDEETRDGRPGSPKMWVSCLRNYPRHGPSLK